ncbi:MAG: alternate-type signal peptide domain-containing protein [Demequina sp.]|jgi:alternate signal-mediated exported protein|nr:alternate-type signal peptide domain-containing protein [Demequina sp.]
MNKTTKAAVATATGIVLLLGGAGSLAYWTDTANTGGSATTINAGTLQLTAVNVGTWTKSFNGGASSTVTPGTFLMVPGDTLVYTQTFNVNARGQDLIFTIAPTDPTLGGALGTSTAVTKTFSPPVFTSSDSSITGTAGKYTIATAANGIGTGTITVTWTIAWPFANAPATDNGLKSAALTLTTGAVVLTQVAS